MNNTVYKVFFPVILMALFVPAVAMQPLTREEIDRVLNDHYFGNQMPRPVDRIVRQDMSQLNQASEGNRVIQKKFKFHNRTIAQVPVFTGEQETKNQDQIKKTVNQTSKNVQPKINKTRLNNNNKRRKKPSLKNNNGNKKVKLEMPDFEVSDDASISYEDTMSDHLKSDEEETVSDDSSSN